MPYTEIQDIEMRSGHVLTERLLEILRDNASVPKAPNNADILLTGSGTWRAPAYCEQIKVTCVAGGGNRQGDPDFPDIIFPGGSGGAGIVWQTITRGATYDWVVGDIQESSNFGNLITCTGASLTVDGGVTFGTNVIGVRIKNDLGLFNSTPLLETVDLGLPYGHGAAGIGFSVPAPGVIIVEY